MTLGKLVDYHCHLDLYPQHEAAFRECRKNGVDVFTMTTTPRAWLSNLELAQGARNIRVGLGLHPQLVGTTEADIGLFEKLAPDAKFIGEVGLDSGPRFYKTIDTQKEIFAKVLEISAKTGPKIISLHCVRAASLILPMIDSYLKNSGCKVVFHWFSGSVSEARKAVALGCWFSINAQMRKAEKVTDLVSAIPLNRMLTETDGPFTESSPGVANIPEDAVHAVKLISDLKGIDFQTTREIIFRNLRHLEESIDCS